MRGNIKNSLSRLFYGNRLFTEFAFVLLPYFSPLTAHARDDIIRISKGFWAFYTIACTLGGHSIVLYNRWRRSAAGCGYSDRREIQRAIIVPVFGERREDGWRISRRGIGIKEIFAR